MKSVKPRLQHAAASPCSALPRLFLGIVLFVAAPCLAQTTGNNWKDLVTEADALSARWTAASWREAVQKYRSALVKMRRSGLRHDEAPVLRSLGLVYIALGDPESARLHLTSSLTLLKELKAETNEVVDALNHVANANLLLGNNELARKYCNESLSLSRAAGYTKGEGWALELTGQIEYVSGNLDQSLDFYHQSLTALRKANDEAGLAQAFLDIGYSNSDLSEIENAVRFFEQALTSWRNVKNPRGEALTLTALGHLHSKLGDKQRAFDLYYKSIDLLEPLEDRIAMAFNFDGIGYIHAGLGESASALQQYTKSFQLYSEAKYSFGEASMLCKIAEIYIALEEYGKALVHLKRALALGRAAGEPRLQATPTALEGKVHERQSQPTLALDAYQKALILNRKGNDKREEAYTLNSIGRIQEALGLEKEALKNYSLALKLNCETRDRFGESGTLYRLAKLQQHMGQVKDAKSSAEQSIALVESLRAGVASHDLRTSYVASVYQLYELYVDILMSLHAVEPRGGFAQAALEASEAGRVRTLLETLAETKTQIRVGVDPKLLERERALQLRLEGLATQLVTAASKRVELEAEIERVTSQYRDIQGQIRAGSPQYAALVQPVTLKVKQIQELLDPGTVMLEYSLGEKRSFLWVLTRNSVSSYELPAQAVIEKVAQQLYSAITAPEDPMGRGSSKSYEADARAISSMLLGSVTELSEATRLVIVADGVLQYIPFSSLPNPAYSQTENLVSRFEIVRLPSASVLSMQRAQFAQREPRPKSVAVLADPVFDLTDSRVTELRTSRRSPAIAKSNGPASRNATRSLRDTGVMVNGRIQRLMYSMEEANAVYAASSSPDSLKAIGFQASRATATSPELSQYRIIHIAAHGVLNSKHPELSGILLSLIDENGKPVEGFLQLHEIYNLKLPAELVVLSACETGIGKQIRGEGFIALTRGFMYAGAARVVASLWKVDDSATAALMAHFYREMFKNGRRPAEALKEAQIAISREKRWRHPYYWAGFVIQGEWR